MDEAHLIKGKMVCSHVENREAIKLSLAAGLDTKKLWLYEPLMVEAILYILSNGRMAVEDGRLAF